MDGYQVAALLREEECCKDAFLIAVSGYGDEQSRKKSAEVGFNQHLVKPVRPQVLLSLIQGYGSTS
jgi:CheY-like chemotaxis protein